MRGRIVKNRRFVMTLARSMRGALRHMVEAPASIRWHVGSLRSKLLYSRAFQAFGESSVIEAPQRLRGVDSIQIGDGCAIYERVRLQVEAGKGLLIFGDNCYLGHDVHLHAIDPVRIGNGCVFADGVFVASTDHDRGDPGKTHGKGPITIEDDVFLGQRAVVLGGVTIGRGATVAAHAVVTRNVAPYEVVAGVPARPIGAHRPTTQGD